MEKLTQNWLTVQCQAIEGISSALFLTLDPKLAAFRPAAQYPLHSKQPAELIPIARITLKQRRKTINTEVKETGSSDRCFDYVAIPISLKNQLIAVIAMKIAHRSEGQRNAVLNGIKTGLKSLTFPTLANKPPAFYTEVVRLIAACLEQDSYPAALNALISQLSMSIGYDRASIGILKHQHIQVIALSNSARFDDRSHLIQAIANVMEEAIDQDSIIVYPPNDNAGVHVHRTHGELSRRFGTGSICTLPLTYDNTIFGALTLE